MRLRARIPGRRPCQAGAAGCVAEPGGGGDAAGGILHLINSGPAALDGTGQQEIDGAPVPQRVYEELLRSYDEGVAEFLGLERVKPNTLGNTRMLRVLEDR